METVQVTIELPVSSPLKATVRALEAARDAQTDPKAKQALAAVTALASRVAVARVMPHRLSRPASLSGQSLDRASSHPT